MASSIAMPMVIAAIVMVIISRGIPERPMKPRITKTERMFGIMAARA